MEYFEQKLDVWILNQQFNSLHNVLIDRPTWSMPEDYFNRMFIYKRKTLELQQSIDWFVTDHKVVNWKEFILVKKDSTVKLMYNNGSSFVQVGTTRNINTDSPLTFVKWTSAQWIRIANWVSLWDSFYEIHNKWAYNSTTQYLENDIVEDSSIKYVNIKASNWIAVSNTEHWKVYDTKDSWAASSDPLNLTYSDVFKWKYLVLKLEQVWIRAKVVAWQYILFTQNNSNLQWITTKIEYVQDCSVVSDDSVLVYITNTNKVWSIPQYLSSWWETIDIYTEIWDNPIIATNDWVYVYNLLYSWSAITWANETNILSLTNIVDICLYNWVIFIANNKLVAFTQINRLGNNTNFYPLDISEIKWTKRIIPFGKMLVLFWEQNKILTPSWDIVSNRWYFSTDLNFESDLFSKYSCYVYMWIFYMIKSNKELVKISILTTNEIYYDIEEQPILTDTKWLLDDINSEVYMCLDWKNLNILNHRWWFTYTYSYNTEYLTWNTGQYSNILYLIKNWKYYWDDIMKEWVWELVEQKVSFTVWTDYLVKMKSFQYIKLAFWIQNKKLDYFLDIEYEIGWHIYSYTVDLNKYLINMDLHIQEWWLWDSLIWNTLLWENTSIVTSNIWNISLALVPIGITCNMMRFSIRSKQDNEFIYWGSIVAYESLDFSVTEYSNKH